MSADPHDERQPTSHEREAGVPWDASYRNGPAPWDIGEPQRPFVRLAAAGAFAGTVLDAGCGTGEHALHVAALGLPVLGVDVAETAVEMARQKAKARGLDAEFLPADALRLDRLGRTFDTVLDCGLFHTFDGAERQSYLASVSAVTGRGALLYVLCFSDVGTGTVGPHPVREDELRAAFDRDPGWDIVTVEPETIKTLFADVVPVWLVTARRT